MAKKRQQMYICVYPRCLEVAASCLFSVFLLDICCIFWFGLSAFFFAFLLAVVLCGAKFAVSMWRWCEIAVNEPPLDSTVWAEIYACQVENYSYRHSDGLNSIEPKANCEYVSATPPGDCQISRWVDIKYENYVMLVRDYGALQMAQSDKANYPAHKQVKRAKKSNNSEAAQLLIAF